MSFIRYPEAELRSPELCYYWMCELDYYCISICSKSLQCATLHQVCHGRSHIYIIASACIHSNNHMTWQASISTKISIFHSPIGSATVTRTDASPAGLSPALFSAMIRNMYSASSIRLIILQLVVVTCSRLARNQRRLVISRFSMMYSVIGDFPSELGASQVSSTES